MSSHLIHTPLGTDDIVQSLREGNREAVMESGVALTIWIWMEENVVGGESLFF